MKNLKLFTICGLVLVTSQLRAASVERHSYSFSVDVPPATASADSNGSTQILLPGFIVPETRLGAPDLTSTNYRVALPPGVTPRLQIRVLQEDFLPGVRPRPVPRVGFDVKSDPGAKELQAFDSLTGTGPIDIERHEQFIEDAAIYAGTESWPAAVARLGEVGVFRDQRYVVITVSPARYDPKAGGVRVARKIELEINFDGDTGERTAPASASEFESTYREMFVNYAEGKTFRLGAASSAATEPSPRAAFDGPSYTGPVYKIKIRQNKTVRLDTTLLTGTGFLEQPMSTWKLTSRGVEAPLQINDVNSNDMMDGPDWVQFWGQALDDEPKTSLNTDIPGTDVDIFQAEDFSDENIYFLSVEAGGRLRMTPRNAAPTFSRPIATSFEQIARAEIDNMWRPLSENDPWYWGPTLRSSGSKTRTDIISLTGLASTSTPIRVVAVVRGLTENPNLFPDHHTSVTLLNQNAQTLMVNNDDGTFDGRMIYTHDFTWPGAPGIASDPVQVKLTAEPIASGSHDVVLDRIEIHYPRVFQAFGDALEFSWPDGDGEVIITGLSSATPELWELTLMTNGISTPVRTTGMTITGPAACPPPGGGSCFTARLRIDNDPDLPDGTKRRFVAFGPTAVATPAVADFVADTQSDLLLPSNQADLIVITQSSVLGATCQPKLAQLLQWRDQNQDLSSKVVSIDDIYDEFNDGLAGPEGIRKFLEYVMEANPGEGWLNPKPLYVLLLGDGSNDYKGGPASGNVIPTQVMFKDDPAFGYFSSDSFLTAVVGSDHMPDLAVGRIPVRSDAECFAAISKIYNYQQSPPAGNWRRHALVVADRGKNFNPNEAEEFQDTNDDALDEMLRPPHTSRRLRYWADYCGGTAAGCTCATSNLMRNDIKAAVNGTDGQSDGVGVMQFVGHGNFDVWSDDSFFDNGPPGNRTACQINGERDSDSLDNGGKLPILFVHNCLSTGLPSTSRTLGRDIFKKADGGVVALFSPSGLTNGYYGQTVSTIVWRSFFGKAKERTLSIPVMSTYASLCVNTFEACENYLLFGDPAIVASFPTVAPPTAVVAAPGNARVDLSWTASTTPGARYDIYRAVDAATNSYTRINGNTPVNATTYADTGVNGPINARTYYYYLVAVDNELFESRVSHFNSDCQVNGPDCLKAKPLNPNPPAAPSGLVVVDAEVGGKLLVSWTANPVTDEIKSYQVRYGTDSGSHPFTANAGTMTSVALTGLQNGETYYIVVVATNTSDLTSPESAEVSGTPTFVRGLRAPQFISALHVDKSGNDALLSWPPVTTDIYGKPATIAHYEIYRGTAPDFIPALGNKIGQTASTSFPDPGALGAGPGYHYLVRAVDGQGSKGGLGNQLPNGIDTMTMTKSTVTPGNVVLSWPAVTTDFNGVALAIDHYEIYARSTKFRMADVRDQQVQMVHSTTSLTADLPPPAENQYYSVVVIDQKGNMSPF